MKEMITNGLAKTLSVIKHKHFIRMIEKKNKKE